MDESQLNTLLNSGGKAAVAAMAGFYRLYAASGIRRLRAARISADDADDLLQQAFMAVWRQVRQGTEVRTFKALLWRAIDSRLIDFYRARSRNPEIDAGAMTGEPSEDDPPIQLPVPAPVEDSYASARDCMREALDIFMAADPRRGTVVFLSSIEGWTDSDMAEYLGKTSGQTRTFLYDCRKRFIEVTRQHCRDYLEEGI
jgi:RNA polymerase sigma factor (sigma-70 family)